MNWGPLQRQLSTLKRWAFPPPLPRGGLPSLFPSAGVKLFSLSCPLQLQRFKAHLPSPCLFSLHYLTVLTPFAELWLSRSLTEPYRRFLLLQVHFPACVFSIQVDNKRWASLPVPCTEWPFNTQFLIRLCTHDVTVEFVPLGHMPMWREAAVLWPSVNFVHLIRVLSCPSNRKIKVRLGLIFLIFMQLRLHTSGDRRNGSFHNRLELSVKHCAWEGKYLGRAMMSGIWLGDPHFFLCVGDMQMVGG